jgi:transcription initiation factor TFIID subunit 11
MSRKSKKTGDQQVHFGAQSSDVDDELEEVGPAINAEEEDEDEDDDAGALGLGMAVPQKPSTMPSIGVLGIDEVDDFGRPADVEREKMNLLLAHFNEEQMSRYEAFRRANINRNAIKKLANSVLNQSISPNVAVALSGLSKVFVGEMVEKAREVQLRMDPPKTFEEYEQRGRQPLKPEHFREAWRMYKLETGTVSEAHWRRQGGDGDGLMFR